MGRGVKRILSVAAAVVSVSVMVQPVSAQNDSIDLDRGYLGLRVGIGAAFPDFDTEAGIRTGVGGDVRLTYSLSKRGGFGFWLGVVGSAHYNKWRDYAVDMPHLVADGESRMVTWFWHVQVGTQWSTGSPYVSKLHPVIAVGVGPVVVESKHMFRITGLDEDEHLTLFDNNSTKAGISGSVGLQWNARTEPREYWGLKLDFIVHHVFDSDLVMSDGSTGKGLTTYGITLGFHGWDWSKH